MYIRPRQRWLLPILIVICGPAPAAGSPLQSFFEASRTLSGQFEQVLFDARDSVQERSTGAFWLQRPGQFRWEYRSPYPQTLLSDGERLWLYDPDLAQVTVRPLAEALASAPAALSCQCASSPRREDSTRGRKRRRISVSKSRSVLNQTSRLSP